MNEKDIALVIKNLRCGKHMHSFRALAKVMVDKHSDLLLELGYTEQDQRVLRGNQLFGTDLCKWAIEVLGEQGNREEWLG